MSDWTSDWNTNLICIFHSDGQHNTAKDLCWMLAIKIKSRGIAVFQLCRWVYAKTKKKQRSGVCHTIKKQEEMNYILHSHLFKFDASINIILRQSHDITVETSSELRYTKRTAKMIIKTNMVIQKSCHGYFLLIWRTQNVAQCYIERIPEGTK